MNDMSYAHPYIPNAAPALAREMMESLGVDSIEAFYATIPTALRLPAPMKLPPPLVSELELRRHMEGLLDKNRSAQELSCFRGGGAAWHYVPAICDEINGRSELLTAYAGEPYEDHGRFQILFEYASLMGELLDQDVVNIPTFDWNQAASTAFRMAGRVTNRQKMLYSEQIGPDRLSTITNYCRSAMELIPVTTDPQTGCVDTTDLQAKLGPDVAGFYFENPGYLGVVEDQGEAIAARVHDVNGLLIVGVDPISLGILKPPGQYGADITCGDLQPLGIHMHQGGGLSGFIASADDERIVKEYPSRLFSLTHTAVEGEWGFGDVLYDDRTSFGAREKGKEFVGTATALWAITAGVYLALMGPEGMRQVGATITQNARYARMRLAELAGLEVLHAGASHFKEFAMRVTAEDVSAAHINQHLLRNGILGGIDVTGSFPGHDNCLLFCVTEMHTRDDIDRLVSLVTEALS